MKNLKKKQKEISRKHSGGSNDQVAEQTKDTTEDEEDSDLASIAREFQDDDSDNNIFDSPFIKKPDQSKTRKTSGITLKCAF